MYNVADADPAIVARDTQMAELTPTSEMQSIAPQPGKLFDPLVTAPVLIAFSDKDAIFPPMCQQFQPLLYPMSKSLDVFHLPVAGHSLMLHRNAPDVEAGLLRWLQKVAPL
jgi:pimeloyl-ACP methyl ester carboxylesterase